VTRTLQCIAVCHRQVLQKVSSECLKFLGTNLQNLKPLTGSLPVAPAESKSSESYY
jgi:hypothetical protein